MANLKLKPEEAANITLYHTPGDPVQLEGRAIQMEERGSGIVFVAPQSIASEVSPSGNICLIIAAIYLD